MKRLLIVRRQPDTVGFFRRWRCCAPPLILTAFLTLLLPAVAWATQKKVLILSEGHGRVSINQMESSLQAHFSGSPNFSIVDLENSRFDQKSYQENLAEAFGAAYANEKLDLVITVGITPLQFAVRYRDKMFPDVPIVFMSNYFSLPEQTRPNVTGVVSAMGVPETIDLALRLHPDTQAIAIVRQASGTFGDDFWLAAEHSELLRHDKVREINLIGSASPELLKKLRNSRPIRLFCFSSIRKIQANHHSEQWMCWRRSRSDFPLIPSCRMSP